MAWGDVLGALGAGLQTFGTGALELHKQEEDRKTREAIASQTNEVRQMIEKMKGENRLDVEASRQKGRTALQELKNSGNLDVQELRNKGMAYVQQLRNDGLIDDEEYKQIGRMNLQKLINEGHLDVANVQGETARDVADTRAAASRDVANTAAGASRYGADQRLAGTKYSADMGYSRGVDVANITQEGQTTRENARRPLQIFRAEQGRYPRGNAAARRAPGGNITTPTFGPSYGDFLKAHPEYGGPAAAPVAAPPQPSFGFSAEPNMSMAPPKPSFGFSIPGAGAPAAAAPPAAAPAPAPAAPLGKTSAGYMTAPVPGGKSQHGEAQLEAQARDLMGRISAAETAGEFQKSRALRQQLTDLLKK